MQKGACRNVSSSKKHISVHDHSSRHKQQSASAEDTSLDPREAAGGDEEYAPGAATPPGDEELAQQLAEREKENGELIDRLQRTMAEFDNYRKRVSREKDDLLKYGAEKMALDMLPVADNFERALEQAKSATDPAAVVAGIEMIHKQFLATLEKYKVRPFDSLGETFNPEKHEAMAQQEHPDYDENTIMAELQKGYFLDDRLLRPASVVVSRGQGENSDSVQES
jgi:molecular chaperone GrpE